MFVMRTLIYFGLEYQFVVSDCFSNLLFAIGYCRESAGILNATTEEFFDEALAEARLSDSRRRSGEPVRLLEGIPISVKDVFDQKVCL